MVENTQVMQDSKPGNMVQIDEAQIKSHLNEVVRETVEETLNRLLDEEADRTCGAGRYERSEARQDTRAGHYERALHTQVGEVTLKVPKLRKLPLDTAIIQAYRRREISVEEALVQMYLSGVSVRRVEDITQALWGTSVSASTISELNKKIYVKIDAWRNRSLQETDFPYVYLDGIFLKRSWSGEVRNVSVLVAFGVNAEGYREMLGVMEGGREDSASWLTFLRHLKTRGLKGVRYIVSDRCLGLVEALAETFPESDWQRCIVHFYRNIFKDVPLHRMAEVSAMLTAIHAQESAATAQEKGEAVAKRLEELKLKPAAQTLRAGLDETLTFYRYPREHWRKLRTNNPMERIMKEIRRRTRVVGSFPDGNSALMLTAARLRHITTTKWGTHKYLDMKRLYEQERQAASA
jgi:putative transposase